MSESRQPVAASDSSQPDPHANDAAMPMAEEAPVATTDVSHLHSAACGSLQGDTTVALAEHPKRQPVAVTFGVLS